MNDVARLFPVDCPGCGRPTNADGIAHVSVVLANMRAAIAAVVEVHFADDAGRCIICDEVWPCETFELLAPFR